MIVVIGDPLLVGEIVRELLAREIEVALDAASDQTELPAAEAIVVAEGPYRATHDLERALCSITLHGGSLVWATARDEDDPDLVALRRRGVPYTIVRTAGLVDVPAGAGLVLVPSDLDRAPFATRADLARAVADEIASGRAGTGASIDVTRHAGARAWASALREAGARAYVVHPWVALAGSVLGIARLNSRDGRIEIASAASPPRAGPRRLAAG